MRRARLLLLLLISLETLSAQSPAFDVVSIKHNTSGLPGFSGGLVPGGRLEFVNTPAARLIRLAYPTQTSELVGAPDWVMSERYDVTAVTNPQTTRAEIQQMLKALLAERFRLVVHQETRERPTFSLVLARSDRRLGPQIRRIDLDCAAVEAANRKNEPVPLAANGAPPCGIFQQGSIYKAGGITMALFSQELSSAAGRVVVDRTGLTGNYELTLRYSTQTPAGSGSADDPPSIFTALQEQLGLKLEPSSTPVPVLVIDQVDHPTPN
jgi:uncharacterized protein (TIGR03435 family)